MRRMQQRIVLFVLLVTGIVLGGSAFRAKDLFAGVTYRSARWETSIAAFEQQDRANPPPKGAVLFVGSSSIRYWDLAKYFPDMEMINRGFGGSQIADSVYFADRIIVKYHPRTVVLYAGDNDLAADKTPEEVFADFQALAEIIRRELPGTKLVVISIKPCPLRHGLIEQVRKTNDLIRTYCQQHDRIDYVDVFHPMLDDDGKPRRKLFRFDCLHLNTTGYKLWTSLVKPHLQ